MGRNRRCAVAGLLVAAVHAGGALPAAAQEEPPVTTVFGDVQVTAISLTVEVLDGEGRLPPDLSAADLEVLEDGVPRQVVAVELPPPAPSAAAVPGEPAGWVGAPLEPWQVVVLFDLTLSAVPTPSRAAQLLAGQAHTLTALGEVEVAVMDPLPEIALAPTRDPALLQAALEKIGRKRRGRQEQLTLRRNAVRDVESDNLDRSGDEGQAGRPSRDFGGAVVRGSVAPAAGSAAADQVGQAARQRLVMRGAARQEYQVLERQRLALLDWLAGQGRRPRRALFLVSDGFDLRPADFYGGRIEEARAQAEFVSELSTLDLGPAIEQVGQLLAAEGWVLVPLSLGQLAGHSSAAADTSGGERYRSFFQDSRTITDIRSGSYLEQPLEPLLAGVEATGGHLALDAGALGAALAGLERRVLVSYQVDRAPDGAIREVQVRARREGLTVRAPRWASAATPDRLAAARARQLLAGEATAIGELPVKVSFERGAQTAEAAEGQLAADVAVAPLREAAARLAAAELRVTVGVLLASGQISISQWSAHAQDLAALSEWRYHAPLRYPPGSVAVAVVVDELTSGAWGGGRVELPR